MLLSNYIKLYLFNDNDREAADQLTTGILMGGVVRGGVASGAKVVALGGKVVAVAGVSARNKNKNSITLGSTPSTAKLHLKDGV